VHVVLAQKVFWTAALAWPPAEVVAIPDKCCRGAVDLVEMPVVGGEESSRRAVSRDAGMPSLAKMSQGAWPVLPEVTVTVKVSVLLTPLVLV